MYYDEENEKNLNKTSSKDLWQKKNPEASFGSTNINEILARKLEKIILSCSTSENSNETSKNLVPQVPIMEDVI